MSTTHDERHEALLQALVTRDKSRADPEIARVLAECVRCRERLDDLERVVGALDELDHERRAVMTTPRTSAQATMEARIRPTLERLRDEERPPGRGTSPTPRRWPWLVLAAAVVLAGFFVARSLRTNVRPIDQTLGGKIELVSPGEIFGPDDAFECRFDAPRGTSFEFHIDLDEAHPILAPQRDEPRWKPTAAERAQIPKRFQWWVKTIDSSNPNLSVESERRWSSRSP